MLFFRRHFGMIQGISIEVLVNSW